MLTDQERIDIVRYRIECAENTTIHVGQQTKEKVLR
jgi:hypothetical protein